LRHRDDTIDVEIRRHGTLALADEVSFVRLETMQAEAVFLRVNGHGAQPEFGARAENPDRDLAAIGSEQFLEGTDGAGRAGFATANFGHCGSLYSKAQGEWQSARKIFGRADSETCAISMPNRTGGKLLTFVSNENKICIKCAEPPRKKHGPWCTMFTTPDTSQKAIRFVIWVELSIIILDKAKAAGIMPCERGMK